MDKRPNVLIIFTDQQRYDTVEGLGYDYMKTPNLNRLCEEGCAYVNAHTHNPVCMPARHDLLLGMPASAHGYFANNEKQRIKDYSIPTLPRLFSDAGYRTAAIGKMHFSPARAHHGYNELYLMEELPKHRHDDQYASFLKESGHEKVQNLHGVRPHLYHTPQRSQVKLPQYETTWVKNQTIEWLENNGEAPFFLFVGYIKPHPPWDIPKEYQGMYDDAEIKKPIEISRIFDREGDEAWFGDLDSWEQKKKIRQAYYTSISMVDDSVGSIIEYLNETGKLDNTLVIFTSDHGEMLQDKGYYSKQQPYNSSVRVPMIVRYPKRFKSGIISHDFVDLLDIMPTCLEACDIDYPGDLNNLYGESLFNEHPGKDREHIISACEFLGPRRWVMSRNKKYKYVYRYNGGFEEFYDLEDDPDEVFNIALGSEELEDYIELKEKAVEYEKQYGPEGCVDEKGKLISFGPVEFEGWNYGKYHLWSNNQTQVFYEGDKTDKGKQLAYEMNYATENKDLSGTSIKEVFNHPVWINDFNRKAFDYGKLKDFLKK